MAGANQNYNHSGQHFSGGEDVARIKEACDIVRLIGEQVAVKPKGREYVCLCPFHDDHNPSMRVIPAKQIFHCFVCGTGGDVFTFIQKYHKMDFRECLEYLSERTGIALTPRKRQGMLAEAEGPVLVSRKTLVDALAGVSRFYQAILAHPEHGAAARAVVAKRSISPAMVEAFSLGAAPARWDGLVLWAKQRGVSEDVLREAGVLKPRDSGGHYDLLRNRLLFPIHDKAGRVVAFGGRKIDEADEPKYLNTPETRLFNKSGTLFALHLAAKKIQAEKTAILTEGYMDALACHQGGFSNAVATLGTALTTEHAALLRPLCDTVILLFDGDDAGQKAADRAVPIFFSQPLDVKIATLGTVTDAKDPDELLKREGGEAIFRQVLAQSIDLLEYRFKRVRDGLKGAGMAAVSKGLLSEIDSMVQMGLRDVEPIRQRLIIRRLAELGNLDESTVQKVIPSGRDDRRTFAMRGATGEVVGEGGLGESAMDGSALDDGMLEEGAVNLAMQALTLGEHLIACVLNDGALWNAMSDVSKDAAAPLHQRTMAMRRLAQLIMDIGEDGHFPSLEAVLMATEDDAVKSCAVCLASRIEMETELNGDRLRAHFQACSLRVQMDRRKGARAQDADLAAGVDVKPRSAIDAILERQRLMNSMGPDRRILPRKS